jgi:RNA polymerase sigma factor (sigma-70 family)
MPELTYEVRGDWRSARLEVVFERAAPVFDAAYLQRLRSGDDETAKHFDRYFRRLVSAKVWGRFTRQLEHDLVDDVMAAVFENIMRGEPRDASRLPAYVFGILSNSTKRALRAARRDSDFVAIEHDRMSDGAQTADRRIEEREKQEAVLKTLGALSRRDREVLLDLFFHELSRKECCEKHCVTSDQLRLILFYAIRRFQKRWAAFHNTKTNP